MIANVEDLALFCAEGFAVRGDDQVDVTLTLGGLLGAI